MENTVFQLLGIENKELPVSNLLAYYLDPGRNRECGLAFLNAVCRLAGIREVAEAEKVTVKRESHMPFEGKNNYIDLLICIGDNELRPERVICIENKINATEGIRQTRRYHEALEARFADCREKDYLYLTKNNSSVNLSSHQFKQIKYAKLGELLADNEFRKMPLAMDFYQYYVLRERALFQEIEENDRPYLAGDENDFRTLIEYLVWKINVSDSALPHQLCCLHGKSAQSDDHFFQLSMQDWEFEFDGKTAVHPITIHLEGNRSEIPLHMELNPYEPYSKIERIYGREFFERYRQKRDELRQSLAFEDTNQYRRMPVRKNAELTIAKFALNVGTYQEYYRALMTLVDHIHTVLNHNGVTNEEQITVYTDGVDRTN